MIIYNVGALIVGVISFILVWIFWSLTKGHLADNLSNMIAFHVPLLVSFVVERFGLRPKLFFIPTTFIAAVLVGVVGMYEHGFVGLVYVVAILVARYFVNSWLDGRVFSKEFQKCEELLEQFQTKQQEMDDEEVLDTLGRSFYQYTPQTPIELRHNKTVVENLHTHCAESLFDYQVDALVHYAEEMGNQLNGKKNPLFSELHESLIQLLFEDEHEKYQERFMEALNADTKVQKVKLPRSGFQSKYHSN